MATSITELDRIIEKTLSLSSTIDLDLSNQNLTEVPEALIKLKDNLTGLNLSDNNLTVIPSWLGSFTKLSMLNIKNNQVADLTPVCTIEGLITLVAVKNHITSIPSNIVKLVNLRFLHLAGNNIEKLPTSIKKLPKLSVLDLRENQISVLQNALFGDGFFKTLTALDLSFNHISELPPSFGKLRVRRLNLSNNQLETLPTSFGGNCSLTHLWIENNSLKNLPSTFKKLGNLMECYIGGNPNFTINWQLKDDMWRMCSFYE